jgi:hypothetical protein
MLAASIRAARDVRLMACILISFPLNAESS